MTSRLFTDSDSLSLRRPILPLLRLLRLLRLLLLLCVFLLFLGCVERARDEREENLHASYNKAICVIVGDDD